MAKAGTSGCKATVEAVSSAIRPAVEPDHASNDCRAADVGPVGDLFTLVSELTGKP